MNFNNQIWVSGKIEPGDFYAKFTGRFSELMQTSKERSQWTVFFNSRGGDTETTLGVYDLLVNCRRKLVGIVAGTAQSGASMVLQACHRRIMTPNSTLMLHLSSVQISGAVEDVQKALDKFRCLDEKFIEIYAKRMKRTRNEMDVIMRRVDCHLNPQEALGLGLIDEIWNSRVF